MNASSTINAPRMVLTGVDNYLLNPGGFPQPVAIEEPEWCTRGAEAHAFDDAGTATHDGPRFGRCTPFVDADGTGHVDVDPDGSEAMTVSDLRTLISDATAALAWIEAQR